jgi:hypothetical protein
LKFKGSSNIIAKKYYLYYKNGEGEARMERYLYYYRVVVMMLKTFVKIGFASRIILFQDILENQNVISICYG